MSLEKYISLLTDSLLILRKNKFLLFFGFFIFIELFFSNINKPASDNSTLNIFLFIFLILIYSLRILSTTSIIKSVNNPTIYNQLPLKNIFLESKNFFWKTIIFELIISLFLIIIILCLSIPIIVLFIHKSFSAGFFMLFFAFLIFIPIITVSFFMKKVGIIYLTLINTSIKNSIEFAYFLFINNKRMAIQFIFYFLLTQISFIISLALFVLFLFSILFIITLFFESISNIFYILILGILFIFLCAIFIFFITLMQILWVEFIKKIATLKEKELAINNIVHSKENLSTESI